MFGTQKMSPTDPYLRSIAKSLDSISKSLKKLEGSKYVSQKKAAEHLGRSERTLLSLRQDGTLEEGKHWVRKTPTKETSHVLYDLESCEEILT